LADNSWREFPREDHYAQETRTSSAEK
jgi:hypothetical protein